MGERFGLGKRAFRRLDWPNDHPMNPFSTTAIFAALLTLSACKVTNPDTSETAPVGPGVLSEKAQQAAMSGKVSFSKHVAPVLQSRCLPCHNGKTMPNLFSMTSRTAAFLSGALGPRIVPGSPDKSLLFLNPSGTHQAIKVMPPVGNRLTAEDLAILRRWITQGADWPSGNSGHLSPPE